MTKLYIDKKNNLLHFRIEKRNDNNWNIFLGNSYFGRKKASSFEKDFDLTEEVIVSKTEIKDFIEKLSKAIDNKNKNEVVLDIEYLENKPQFQFSINYDDKKDMYKLMSSYNSLYSAHKSTREEDQYLYENGGSRISIQRKHSQEDLMDFINQLKKDIK